MSKLLKSIGKVILMGSTLDTRISENLTIKGLSRKPLPIPKGMFSYTEKERFRGDDGKFYQVELRAIAINKINGLKKLAKYKSQLRGILEDQENFVVVELLRWADKNGKYGPPLTLRSPKAK